MESDSTSSSVIPQHNRFGRELTMPQYGFQLRHIPLRQVLVVPFILQILLAVGLTGFFSLRNGQRAVQDLVNRLLLSTSNHVTQYLDNYLSVPISINQVNTNLLRQEVLPIDNSEAMGQHFWQQSLAHPRVSYIGLALPDGRYIGAGNWLDGYDIVIDETDRQGNTQTYTVDEQGNRIDAVYEYDYFPREESWYIRALERSDRFWDVSIEDVDPYYISAGVVQSVYDSDGTLMGVLSADLVLSDISETLAQLIPTGNSKLLILERDGQLVANADVDQLLVKSADDVQRLRLSEVDDPMIQAIAQTIQSEWGGLSAITDTQSFILGEGRDRYFIHIQAWQGELGLDWVVVLAIPEADFMEQIYANTRLTILLCGGALLIAIGMGWLTARWISRPIERFNATSQAIAEGDLSQAVEPHAINEINQLANGFNHMIQTLNHLIHQLENANADLEARVEERTAELRQILQQLQQAQWQLIHAEKMSSLSQLVAGVAHEINNPVGVIHGNLGHASAYMNGLLKLLQLYEDTIEDPPYAIQQACSELDTEFVRQDFPLLLQSMEVSTTRICAIVQSLRKFSRLDEADVKTVDIHEGLDSAVLILQNRLRGVGRYPTIQVEQDYQTLPMVECHSSQINQVFLNLLTNAIDAIHQRVDQTQGEPIRKPTIRIETRTVDEDWVTIAIHDTGIGIPDDIQSKLFDPFFSTKPVGQGTGLGLFVSYQIVVEEHRGELILTSMPEQGSTVVVKLSTTWLGEPIAPPPAILTDAELDELD